MESFLKSLTNETRMYRSTALRVSDARRDLNTEYEGVRATSSRLVHSNRPRTVAEKAGRGTAHRIERRPATSRAEPTRAEWNAGTVWITNAPCAAPKKATKEYKQGILTSRTIEVEFDKSTASPRRPRVRKTPECVRRMKPDVSDYAAENDAFYKRHVNDLFVQGNVCHKIV